MFGQRRFEEGQAFAPFVYPLLIVGIGAVLLPPRHWPLNAIVIILLACLGNLLYMRTEMSGRSINVRFGVLLPFYTRIINVDDIETFEAVTYNPIAEYGGWGIRGFGSKVALNARGNLGVLLRLKAGRTLLIGSQRPDDLAAAIRETKS